MKYLKYFEHKQKDSTLNNLKKGDKVVFLNDTTSSKLNCGETYIINSLLKMVDENDFTSEVETIKDCDVITLKKLNGDVIFFGESPMLFYPYRFTSELKYNADKYNL